MCIKRHPMDQLWSEMVSVLSTWKVVIRNEMFAGQVVFTVGTLINTNDEYPVSFAE